MPSIPVASEEQKRLAHLVIQRYFRISQLDSEDVQNVLAPIWVPECSVAAFEYTMRDSPDSPVLALFAFGPEPNSFDIHSARSDLLTNTNGLDSDIAALFLGHRPEHVLPRAIHFDKDLGCVGWYISESRGNAGGSVLVTQNQGGVVMRSEFTFHAPELSFLQRLRCARCLSRAVQTQKKLSKGRAWFGVRGVLVESEGLIWIVRDRGAQDPQVDRLTREAFDNWISDTASKLPADWSTVEQRQTLDVRTIAATALSDSFSTADRAVESVNRLGLMQTLAREQDSQQP
jgi:hypothetical protein